MIEHNKEENTILVGYVRKSHSEGQFKLSINVDAFKECQIYQTSDGNMWMPCEISISALMKILKGEVAVSTIVQFQREE